MQESSREFFRKLQSLMEEYEVEIEVGRDFMGHVDGIDFDFSSRVGSKGSYESIKVSSWFIPKDIPELIGE